MKMKFCLLLFVMILNQCFNPVVRTDYLDQKTFISKEDKIIILPSYVLREADLGSKELSFMYDNLIYSLLREKNYQALSSEEWTDFLKKKKIEGYDFQKTELREVFRENGEKLKELNTKYFIRAFFIEHPREGVFQKKNILITLKILDSEGRELNVLNAHYESEDSVSSQEAAALFKDRVCDWMNFNEKSARNK